MLRTHGHLFSRRLWDIIFRGVLLPIFDNVTALSEGDAVDDNEWLTTTCLPALNAVVDLFSHFFSLISFLLDELFLLLVTCVSSGAYHLSGLLVVVVTFVM